MSLRRAQNAGAKQQLRKMSDQEKETNPHKTFGGKCAFAHCDKPATVRRGKHNYCRTHGQALD